MLKVTPKEFTLIAVAYERYMDLAHIKHKRTNKYLNANNTKRHDPYYDRVEIIRAVLTTLTNNNFTILKKDESTQTPDVIICDAPEHQQENYNN